MLILVHDLLLLFLVVQTLVRPVVVVVVHRLVVELVLPLRVRYLLVVVLIHTPRILHLLQLQFIDCLAFLLDVLLVHYLLLLLLVLVLLLLLVQHAQLVDALRLVLEVNVHIR